MEIRTLKRCEMIEAWKNSKIAFGGLMNEAEDLERIAKLDEAEMEKTWGCIAENGDVAASMVNHRYTVWFEGSRVQMGGVGAVACRPEYRYGGCVRSVFEVMLRAAREKGEVISSLFPFKYEFYRKFGYELVELQKVCSFSPTALIGWKHTGSVRRAIPGNAADQAEMLAVYESFAKNMNMMVCRTQEQMDIGDPFTRQWYTMLLGDGEATRAYVTYSRDDNTGVSELNVRECAWTDEAGFKMILGYLARMSADYKTIRMTLPRETPIQLMLDDPRSIQVEAKPSLQARLLHVEKALSLMKVAPGAAIVVEVQDDFLPENSGVYRMSAEGIGRTEDAPDLIVSVQAMTQLALGTMSIDEALYRRDVQVRGNMDVLRSVFTKRPVGIRNHF